MRCDADQPPGRRAISRPGLARELLRRRDADQAARADLIAKGPAVVRQSIAVDEDNTLWLKRVVEDDGWPTASLVGVEGAHAAWLLAQHADRDLPFQRHCLALLIQAAEEGEASKIDAARLTDRVRLADGESQVFGTQLNARDGWYEAPRLADPQRVDERRAAVGLAPLSEQIAQAIELHGLPAPARSRCPKCKATIDVWLPELGGRTAIRCGSCGFKTTVRARIRDVGR
jgi:DNA-directed RNA polymerase subunit RPC12/RpoP